MTRAGANFLLDALLLLAFVVLLAATGVIQFVFPPATQSNGWLLWGMGVDRWIAVQSVCVGVLAVGVLVHLILHWTWVCGFVTSRMTKLLGSAIKLNESARTLYGVGVLIVVLAGLGVIVGAATFMVRPAAGAPQVGRPAPGVADVVP